MTLKSFIFGFCFTSFLIKIGGWITSLFLILTNRVETSHQHGAVGAEFSFPLNDRSEPLCYARSCTLCRKASSPSGVARLSQSFDVRSSSINSESNRMIVFAPIVVARQIAN